MMPRLKLLSIFVLAVFFGYGQSGSHVTLSGMITDLKSGEHLAGASFYFPALKRGTSSNSYGYYAIQLPQGRHALEISFVGYGKIAVVLSFSKDTVADWHLIPGVDMAEVSVTAQRMDKTLVNGVMPGIYYLSARNIELAPALLGESDALKSIQLLPGVKSGNEGTSGINVRGGSHDQNLILLDGVPVYNTNHLFGYLSTFNTDAIREIRFYKGGIPSRYGGRLSSVVDVAMKEGNSKEAGGEVGLNPVSGRLMLEGPLKKEVASFMISGRRSWLDIPLRAGQWISGNMETLGYAFYDLNAKINWIINPRNRVFLSHYQGRDGYFVNTKDSASTDRYSFNWGNFTSVARWNLVLSPRLFMNTSAYHSLYRFREAFENVREEKTGQHTSSGLEEYSLKGDFDCSLTGHAVKFGYQVSWQSFSPEMTSISGDLSGIPSPSVPETESTSLSLYGEDEFSPVSRFTMNAGLRCLVYHSGNETVLYPEPRLSVRYSANQMTDLKMSVQRMVQTVHLLTNNALNMPTDLWVTAGEKTPPEEAWLYDMGINTRLAEGLTLEGELYCKSMNNLLEYRPGVIIWSGSGKLWEELTVVGKGLNYGAEVMVEKTTGRLTGWAGYSLSWALRKFDEINNGRYFPFKYDRRHDFSLLATYRVRETGMKQKLLTSSFVFASGNAITIPDDHIRGMMLPGLAADFSYIDSFSWYESFPHPNNYRMPPFHHLDVAYAATKKLRHDRRRTWTFSVYNVYNRLNPYFYYKTHDSFKQISMLPVVPSVSWSLTF